jgi:hypothetical protein
MRPDRGGEGRRIAGDVDGLQPARMAGNEGDRGPRNAQRLRQQSGHRGIGPAPVGDGAHPDPEDRGAIVANIGALDAIGRGVLA